MVNKPEYELNIYRQVGSKRQMDFLNFNKEETLIFEGQYLPDFPVEKHINLHHFTEGTVTQIVRELDMTVKAPVKIKNETFGIYGYCDYSMPEQTQTTFGRTNIAK